MTLTRAQVEAWTREKLEQQFYLLRGHADDQARSLTRLQEQIDACPACQAIELRRQIEDGNVWDGRLREALGNPVCGMLHEIDALKADRAELRRIQDESRR